MCQIWSSKPEEMSKVSGLYHTQMCGKTVCTSTLFSDEHTDHISQECWACVIYLYIPVFQKSILHPHYPVNVVVLVRAWNLPGDGQTMAFHLKAAASPSALHYPRNVGDQNGDPRVQMKNAQEPKWREGEAGMERIKRDRRRLREGVTLIYSRRATRISIRSVIMNHWSSAVAPRWGLGWLSCDQQTATANKATLTFKASINQHSA